MPDNSNDSHRAKSHSTDRRQFLKSFLGLGNLSESKRAEAVAPVSGDFLWADLRTGQVGFPTGTQVISGPPGSLMTVVAAAAVLEEELFPSNKIIDCRGQIVIGKRTYNCHVQHGELDLKGAIGNSCNVFFAQIAELLAPGLLLNYAHKFGLDHRVAGYASKSFPEAIDSSNPQDYLLGVAEGLKLNPLQALQMSALIATRGDSPYLHSAEDLDSLGDAARLNLRNTTWDILQQAMQSACKLGTACQLDVDNKLQVSAITGAVLHGKLFQSWITGYFPADNPRHAFCARVQTNTSSLAAISLAQRYLFSTEWP